MLYYAQVYCPTLGHVLLSHLQSLFLGLEERRAGDVLVQVALKYREELSEDQKNSLKDGIKSMDMSILLDTLRDLATGQLVSGGWSPDADMKEYMGYIDPSITDFEWFHRLPDFKLKHVYHLYHFLKKY